MAYYGCQFDRNRTGYEIYLGVQIIWQEKWSSWLNDFAFIMIRSLIRSPYTNALKKLFVIEDCPAWSPNLRSKTAIRTADTRYFVDPSIATAALGVGPGELLNDLETCGLLFETLCIRDLRIYTEVLDGNIYHFRTKDGLECDAVIHMRKGRYGLVEIKLGGDKLIEEGVRTLKTVSEKIDTTRMKEPSFLMVLTGTSPYAYQREDGVYIVPITTLKN